MRCLQPKKFRRLDLRDSSKYNDPNSSRQHIFQRRGGYYPDTEKCAAYPIPSVVFFDVDLLSLQYTYIDHEFSSVEGATTPTLKNVSAIISYTDI